MSDRDWGAASDRIPPAQRTGDDEGFSRVVGALSNGELRHHAPFDLVTSAALANTPAGVEFDMVRAHVRTRFRLQLHEEAPDSTVPPREIVDHASDDLEDLLEIVHSLLVELADSTEESPNG